MAFFFLLQSITTAVRYIYMTVTSSKISQLSILVWNVKHVSTPLLISQFTSTQDLINYGNQIFLLILDCFVGCKEVPCTCQWSEAVSSLEQMK